MSTVMACNCAQPKVVIRKTASYHPSVWGDRFLNYTLEDSVSHTHKDQQIEELKEEVRRGIVASEPSRKLKLIDDIQRLGVGYHFEDEIEQALQHFYNTFHESHDDDDDLYLVALRFRLLRQQGFDVSSDVFSKFKDERRNFKESIIGDVSGMLGLYEASHLLKHGENILEEAMTFTSTHISSIAHNNLCSNFLKPQIVRALKRPIRKDVPRREARHYVSMYERDGAHNQDLLNLAKLDFNQLQSLHKKELCDISMWWKDLDFGKKLPFARDRLVECYFWITSAYHEPQYSLGRKLLAKVFTMTSIVDDTYDVYATFEELELFTDAIERWNMSCMDQLPEYMQWIYKALLDVYEEIEEEMIKMGHPYRVHYAKGAMKKIVHAYFVEAKWLHEGYFPTVEEYLGYALVTSGYHLLTTTSYLGMGEIATKEAFDWLFTDPKILRASQIICRLADDIVGHKFEQERGHTPSAVECYLKQYNVSEENEVYDEFRIQIKNAWKDINQECLRPTVVPLPLLTRVLNLARVIDVLYKDQDGYTHASKETKEIVASVLIDPIPTCSRQITT